MSERVKGITLEINGDTTKLSSALKDTNKEIKSTQSQLKDVERLLKLDPTNAELLRQKTELLRKAVEQTSEKLTVLKKAEDDMKSKGVDENSEQYQALQREIIATEGEIENLKSRSESTSQSAQSVANTIREVANAAGEVADKTRKMSDAAQGAIKKLGQLGLSAITGADDLNTLSQQSGFSTSDIQKFRYAADLIDVSSEDIISSAKRLKKSLTSTQSAEYFEKLGVATTDASGNFRDSTEIFWDVVEALGNVENETERDTIAMQLLGRDADSLAGIIDDGGKAFRELGKQAEEMGIIMSQDTVDDLNQVNDAIDTVKMQATGTMAQVGAELAETMMPTLEKLIGTVGRILAWVSKLDSGTLNMIVTILAVVAAFSPIAGIISSIAGMISTLIPIIATINAVIAANPIILIIAAIVAAVTAITILVIKHWDEIKAALEAFWDKVKAFAEGVKQAFQNIADKVGSVISTIKSKFQDAIDFIRSLPSMALQWGRDLIENFKQGIIDRANALLDKIRSIAQSIKDYLGFSEPKKGPLSNFHTYAPDMMELFAKGIKDNEGMLKSQIESSFNLQPLISGASGVTNNTTNLGGFSFVINANEGQNARDIANEVMSIINTNLTVNRRFA